MATLQGERVLLRPVRPADVVAHREFATDRELAWLDSGNPREYPQVVENFLSDAVGDDAHFSIVVGDDYVGYCSLKMISSSEPLYELGIVIGDRNYWNHGFGREVVSLLVRHGFRDLGAGAIELTTHGRNERAVRCFTAVGFRERFRKAEAIPYEEEHVDMIEMSIDRAAWFAGRGRS